MSVSALVDRPTPTRGVMEWLASHVLKRRGIERLPVHLHRKRIYILPTRFGLFFGLMLLVMLIGSLNYDNNLGLVLSFLLASLALVCTFHTARNLYDLYMTLARARPVFAGESADFHVLLRNSSPWPRPALKLATGDIEARIRDIPARGEQTWSLRVPSRRRGRLHPGRLRVSTAYPLGMFESWAWVEPDASCVVYPAPEASDPPIPPGHFEGEGHFLKDEGEDFAGLRDYRPGDSSRRIAWKAVAHSDRLVTKEYLHTAGQTRWLDWDDTAGLETEARLSRLCRWVLDAHARCDHYGLRLPGFVAEPALSADHRERCLRALALFDETRLGET